MALHDKITKQEIEEMVSLYKESKSSYRVAEQIGRSQHAVLRHLHKVVPELVEKNRTTVPNNTRRKKYTVNHDYFEQIDSEEKAYILGFIYADGYVADKGALEIGLHPKDISILEFIKKQLGATAPIKPHHSKNSYSKVGLMRLQVHSKKLTEDLKKWGCCPNKTFKIKFPSFLKESLTRHFIRGYFDGDGCISNGKKYNSFTVNIASNIDFLEGMGKHLQDKGGLSKITIYKYKNIGYLLYQSMSDINTIYNYLYKDSTYYLERKYNIFQSFLEKVNKQVIIDTHQIIELYKKEKSVTKVAKQLNLAVMTVYNRIKKENPNLLYRRNLTVDDKRMIKDLYDQGYKAKTIAKFTGFKLNTVFKYK